MLKAYSLFSDQMHLVTITGLLLKVLKKGQTTNSSLQYTCQKIAPFLLYIVFQQDKSSHGTL